MSESTIEMTEATLSKALNDEAEAEYALWKAQEWVKIARRGALTARRLADAEDPYLADLVAWEARR